MFDVFYKGFIYCKVMVFVGFLNFVIVVLENIIVYIRNFLKYIYFSFI